MPPVIVILLINSIEPPIKAIFVLYAIAEPIAIPSRVNTLSVSPWAASIICLNGHPPTNTEPNPTRNRLRKLQSISDEPIMVS